MGGENREFVVETTALEGRWKYEGKTRKEVEAEKRLGSGVTGEKGEGREGAEGFARYAGGFFWKQD